jgi:patatin-like phospholipase/acyl hydrolase
MMQAEFVSYMEDLAYSIAFENKCIKRRKSRKVSMVELFDMVAGVETGSILATTITLKNDDKGTKDKQPNKYYAD